jgi:hypothetical protein
MRLSPRDRKQLAAALGCPTAAVTAELRKYEAAAAEEYVRMILGQRVFTRGQDMREWRLVLIIRHVFDGQLPSERTISNLFQTSTGQSRSLLRAVMAKYQYELKEGVDATLGQMVARARQAGPGEPWTVTTDSENLVDALNREIANIDGTLSQVVRVRNTVSTYEIANASYLKLKQRYAP